MITRMTSLFRRFARDESGNTNTVAFAIWTPILLLTLATALEVGIYTARATLMERGMDIAARDIRLGTGTAPQHNEIVARICEEAVIIANCEDNMRLDTHTLAPSNAALITRAADICEQYERPVATFEQAREMLGLRPFAA